VWLSWQIEKGVCNLTDIVGEASQAAEEIRAAHWGDELPVDPARVAGSLGIEVVEANLDADVSGAIQREAGEQAVIFVSATDHPNRQRFTCAHEIGHFVKHADEEEVFGYIDYRDEAASMGLDADERYANAFAAALLMPHREVERLHELGLGEEELAKRFGVSQAAMVNRLKNLLLYR
jgi:Zn-dependent peptidase ImmA (M78 family)